jgi:hypothetical protein
VSCKTARPRLLCLSLAGQDCPSECSGYRRRETHHAGAG